MWLDDMATYLEFGGILFGSSYFPMGIIVFCMCADMSHHFTKGTTFRNGRLGN